MASSLPDGHIFKLFADNFFTSLPLVEELKKHDILYVGTIRLPRMKKSPLMVEKDLKKKGRGAYDKLDENSNMIAVRWFDNKSVNLVSSYAGIEPVGNVRRYDRSLKEHIIVQQPYIVKVYNEYMGGIDKLDMMCALYKPRLRTRRWVHLHLAAHCVNCICQCMVFMSTELEGNAA